MRPLTSNEKLALALIAFCLLAVVVSWPRGEPKWNGRTLKEWLRVSHDVQEALSKSHARGPGLEALLKQGADAEEAIYGMGPAIVPKLIAIAEEQDSPLRAKLERWSKSVGWTAHPFERDAPLKRAAFGGLGVLGSHAATALPVLSNALFQPEPDYAILGPLIGIGKPALPVLMAALTNSQPRVQGMAYSSLAAMGTNAASLAPNLRGLLAHPDLETRGRAIALLAGVTPVQENPFPPLLALRADPAPQIRQWVVSGLSVAARSRKADSPGMEEAAAAVAELASDADPEVGRRAAWGLQHFKAAAAPHIPVLLGLLKESDERRHFGAAVSLLTLKLRQSEIIPALAELLTASQPHIREEVAAGLREMATEAEKFQPGLIGSLGDLGKDRYEQKRLYREDYERREAKRLERLTAKPEAKK
ncbi:MAG: hypothetical protein FD161_611 [Limisphaerales bacterium]|nr:MAG: hypothetical protein FD161_611 [Limisphaerales bacterium]KAG0510216.1 MAG: hypothetical protein E1N63_611 [Limisphaerales bacterium]TXT51901.1 MAG: hypothetical protein FD140_1289 [Limisphaerales bacterium]